MAKNKRAKGLLIQRKAVVYLTDKYGWLCHNQTPGGMFNSNKDLFNLFDLVCINSDNITHRNVIWVQVKCQKVPLKPYEKWCDKYNQLGLFLVWKGAKKGFKEYWINGIPKVL